MPKTKPAEVVQSAQEVAERTSLVKLARTNKQKAHAAYLKASTALNRAEHSLSMALERHKNELTAVDYSR